jgi:class 3 adenylate cyclase/tetratricopeptide (TPR) repeat protein/DNA polymerase III delta prime subunit
MSTIAEWLDRHGLSKYAALFADNAIGLDILPSVTDRHLEQLGMPLGDRLRIQRAIRALIDAKTAKPGPEAAAERRQLTVMFCDLVGSTQLSQQMDPEDYRDVIRAYRSAVARVVARYEGSIAQYLGDGVLVYFGYPIAHEHDAERAIRAGLDIVAAMGDLESGGEAPLHVRVGIATGLVVTGDVVAEGGAEERTAVGETPNLAARLQEAAEPNCVVVSAATKRLVEGRLELEPLPALALKGVEQPVTAYRATGVLRGRMRALIRQRLARFVGRANEFDALSQVWRDARSGFGHIALISGEPGIGKTLLAEVLRERLRGEPHACIRYQCTPFHTHSAFHPVIAQLSRAAGFAALDDVRTKMAKLEELFEGSFAEREKETSIALMAALLSLEQVRFRLPAMTPRQQKTATIELLRRQLDGLARQTPVLVLVEDAHWIDPSTKELLDELAPGISKIPALLLITHRPGFDATWIADRHATRISLGRLSSAEGLALVGQLAGERTLSAEIVAQIVDRSDGIPLFIEEMTKSVLELEIFPQAGGGTHPARGQRPIAVPSTLQDSLMARLDRLGPAREVAQIGAVIGREFSRDVIAASAQIEESELDSALERLIAAELIFVRRPAPAASYAFKHSLVRDAAYDSLLRKRRQELHARIGGVLEEHFSETVASEPELLAQHFEGAALPDKALKYWRRAGVRAFRASAIQESIAHFSRALQRVPELDPANRLDQEISLLTGLGESLMLSKGFAAPEVRAVYERAEALAAEIGELPRAARVVFGLWAYHHVRADMAKAHALAERLDAIATRMENADEGLGAQAALGITSHCMGEFALSRRRHEHVVRNYRFESDRTRARTYVSDPGAISRTYLATTLWCLGLPEQALKMSVDAVEGARASAHPYTLATVLALTARFHQIRRDAEATLKVADETIAVSTQFDFPIWRTLGDLLVCWVRAERGDLAALEKMQAAIARYRRMGVGISLPYYTALLAEQCARRGRFDEALAMTTDAIAESIATKAHAEEPEIRRIECDVLRMRGGTRAAECGPRLQEALSLAERQGAMGWRLRLAMSLARRLRDERRLEEARELLTAERRLFTEGFGAGDLQAADALLSELA